MVFAIIAAFMAFGAVASADEFLEGTIDEIQEICLYESDCDTDVPVEPCEVKFVFTTLNEQTYTIIASACGTQINLALLKMFNWYEADLPAYAKLRYVLVDTDGDTLFDGIAIEIVKVCVGEHVCDTGGE
jgi:hypothetical protein